VCTESSRNAEKNFLVEDFLVSDYLPADIELSFHAISGPSKILELKEGLDAFVNKWSKNPFLLGGFISQYMRSNQVRGWTPFVLVVKADEKIVGTAPLMIKTRLGMRFAQFFLNDVFSPDFVIDDRYREACMGYVVEYLFKTLNCRFARFYLPAESPNLETLEQQCKVHGIGFSAKNQSRHRIIPVECTWDEFQEKKGRRRIIRQIERKLNQIGPWKIVYVENVSNRPDVLEKILDVERMSWKESWRSRMQIAPDEDLLTDWRGSQIVARTKTDFKCSVWFLQINRETVAYAFVDKYKGTAFIVKTSYDDRYSKFYVGKYIMHIAIRDMFNEGQIKTIDFLTELPFMSFWTSLSLSRIGVLMSKGNLATLAERLLSNTFVSRVLKVVLGKLAL
jgi:CelD/BcsL family acetyltransferase involved in cellulose biosynthesis